MQFRSVRQTVELTGHALYGCLIISKIWDNMVKRKKTE